MLIGCSRPSNAAKWLSGFDVSHPGDAFCILHYPMSWAHFLRGPEPTLAAASVWWLSCFLFPCFQTNIETLRTSNECFFTQATYQNKSLGSDAAGFSLKTPAELRHQPHLKLHPPSPCPPSSSVLQWHKTEPRPPTPSPPTKKMSIQQLLQRPDCFWISCEPEMKWRLKKDNQCASGFLPMLIKFDKTKTV